MLFLTPNHVRALKAHFCIVIKHYLVHIVLNNVTELYLFDWLQLVGHLMLVVKKVADQLRLPNGYRVGMYPDLHSYFINFNKIFIVNVTHTPI